MKKFKQARVNGGSNYDGTTPSAAGGSATDLANRVPGEVKESRQQPTCQQTTRKGKCSPSRAKRRTQYAKVQNLYQMNRSRCAKSILSGDWNKDTPSLSIDTQEGFWRPLMEARSKVDLRTPPQVYPSCEATSVPIAPAEVEKALRGLKDGVPGSDGVNRFMIRRCNRRVLAAHMSLWLGCNCPPSVFREGVTTLIPKSAEAKLPGEYRPITVSTIIARLFHRILASRIEENVPLSPRQKAFRRGDGLADNVWLLRSTLRDRTKHRKPVFVTFIDVAKAFDSVSHDSILIAARRVGVSETVISYVQSLYSGTTTRLKAGGSMSDPITVRRGVRQGDPLSPLLFNYVMDWVLSDLDPQLGITLERDLRLNHLAFADDVSLITETREGAKRLAQQFESGLSEVGLLPNAKKSATLAITVDGRKQRWYCDSAAFLLLNGHKVPSMNIFDAYRYLGTAAGIRVDPPNVNQRLQVGLDELTSAPLKPQQRLFILRVHLLPSLYHQLVLDQVTASTVKWLDRAVRKKVRIWLRLPHDTPLPMFHAKVSDGGLGIPLLGARVRVMKKDRLENLYRRAETGDDRVLHWYTLNSSLLQAERERLLVIKYKDTVVNTKADIQKKLTLDLYDSLDGDGLRHHSDVPYVHSWVSDGTSLMSGRKFIGACQTRCSTLYTKGRASRGRPSHDSKCETCGDYESLGHVLQTCARTYKVRGDRHDLIAKKLGAQLETLGYEVREEPQIRTPAGIRKPDIVAWLPGDSAVVVDVTVVSTGADLVKCHVLKQQYYDTPEIKTWVSEKAECDPGKVTFTAAVFNWRGAVAKPSASDLLTLGVTRDFLKLLSVVTLEKGYDIWAFSRKSTLGKHRS